MLQARNISFGSCNRQTLLQPWNYIHTDLFIWTGDAYYAVNNTVEGISEAIKNISSIDSYQQFKKRTRYIEGIWDDHDYGVNDAGRLIGEYNNRKLKYIDFLYDDTRKVTRNQRQGSDGLYYSFDVNISPESFQSSSLKEAKDSANIKFILLDTRSFRDQHYIRSIGEIHFPFSALLAAFIRTMCAAFGLSKDYNGDVLGEGQWRWLESELAKSTSDFHVLISSIQILTTNPAVESWGHFPQSKTRLLDLIKRQDPQGLVLLSGDVHHAEISESIVVRSGGEEGLLTEITSSGLTHTCADTLLTKILCPKMIQTFHKHRIGPNKTFIGKNFGLFELAVGAAGDVIGLNISIRSLEPQSLLKSVLSVVIPPRTAPIDPIVEISTVGFARFSEDVSADTLADIILVLGILAAFLLLLVYHAVTVLRCMLGPARLPEGESLTREKGAATVSATASAAATSAAKKAD